MGLSAFFSGAETALTAASRVRLKVEEEDGDISSHRALRLIEDYDGTLIALLVCNNIVNILAAALTTTLFTDIFGLAGAFIATLLVTGFIIVFGEVMPKSFSNENAEGFLKFAAPVLLATKTVLRPIIALLRIIRSRVAKLFHKNEGSEPTITEDELRVIIEEIEDEGVIEEQQSELLQSALLFSAKTAGDIITHRVDIIALPKSSDVETVKDTFLIQRVSRLPIYETSIDEIVGIINQKDFFGALLSGGDTSMDTLMQKPLYIPPKMSLLNILKLLDAKKKHMAVVVDSFGGTEGILTLEDVLEELVGEIWDEHDEIEREITMDGEAFLMSGDTKLSELYDEAKLKLPKNYADLTVAGLILSHLGTIPKEGQVVQGKDFNFTITCIAEQRILSIKALAVQD